MILWAVTLAAALPAQGKLGETLEALQARYGEAIGVRKQGELRLVEWEFKGFKVVACLDGGVSVAELLMRIDAQKRIEAEEALALATAIAGEAQWTPAGRDGLDRFWKGKSGCMVLLKRGVLEADCVMVGGKGFLEVIQEREKRDRKAMVDAFGNENFKVAQDPFDEAGWKEFDARQAQRERQRNPRGSKRIADAPEKMTDLEVKALKFQMEGASNGYAHAQCSLGLRYLEGRGVETNRALAVFWLNQSAAQGNLDAKAALAKIGGAK